MKLSVTQENLNKALLIANRVVGSKTGLPVLNNVLLVSEKGRLKISATNLEVGVNYWIGSKIEEEGSITVPARLFGDFIASLPSGDNVDLLSDGAVLKIKATNFESSINGIPAEEFPLIPQVKSKAIVALDSEKLKDAISQTAQIASADEARPVLTGVYLYIIKGGLTLVATDSYRLAEKKIKIEKREAKFSAIIPARTMSELARILSEISGEVKIFLEENQIMFAIEDLELTSRLIDGQFPNYQQIIPPQSSKDTVFRAETDELIRIAKIAGLFARENAGSVRLEVKPKENIINIISATSQVGENTSTYHCQAKGPDVEITLNSRYLLDALATIKTAEAEFIINGKLNPVIVKPVSKEKELDYIHIIMPLRT